LANQVAATQPHTPDAISLNPFAGGWWPTVLKLAAESSSFWVASIVRVTATLAAKKIVSQQQLTEMVHDMVVANRRKSSVWWAALVLLGDVELQRRQDLQSSTTWLPSKIYGQSRESSRYLKTLATK
jgi:hypothetical protein